MDGAGGRTRREPRSAAVTRGRSREEMFDLFVCVQGARNARNRETWHHEDIQDEAGLRLIFRRARGVCVTSVGGGDGGARASAPRSWHQQ